MSAESDLFAPVKRLFEDMGYSVNAEVKSCDMTAVREGELIIIELKKNLSVHLLEQALVRQKTGASVYVAVPKPKKYSPLKFRDTLYVLKKLELGLIFVALRGEFSYAEIVCEPLPFVPAAENKRRRAAILKEIEGRSIDTNTGGVTKRRIATAFTEMNIHLACALDIFGDMSPARAAELTGIEKAQSVLSMNVFKWFKRVSRGVYSVTEEGRLGIMEYPELEKYYTDRLMRRREEENG